MQSGDRSIDVIEVWSIDDVQKTLVARNVGWDRDDNAAINHNPLSHSLQLQQ